MGQANAEAGAAKNQNSRAEWRRASEETDRLFALPADDVLYERPIPERHRVIFYLGHLEAFDWNQARAALDLCCRAPIWKNPCIRCWPPTMTLRE